MQMRRTIDTTDAGEQRVSPGIERITDREMIERRMNVRVRVFTVATVIATVPVRAGRLSDGFPVFLLFAMCLLDRFRRPGWIL